uniref:G_PROTEIN_RECEP_F1_2 domain-containing protein n=1 Tax=Parastrongyloides trichosuri TaxID=131310 RepID=A0A0N4Z251_PARTI
MTTICFDYGPEEGIINRYYKEILFEKRKNIYQSILDTSPPVNNNWTFLCNQSDDNSIINYDEAKNNLADNVIPTTTMILSLIGFIINLFFIYIVVIGLKKKLLPFKGHTLMLNRSITDAIVSVIIFAFTAMHKFNLVVEQSFSNNGTEIANSSCYIFVYTLGHGRTWFTLLLTIDYWVVSGAYASLAIITFIAVRYPVYTRTSMTDKKIVIGTSILTVVGVLYSIVVIFISKNDAFNVFNESYDLIQWTVSIEDYIMSIFNMFIVALAFTIVILSHILIVIFLYRHKRQSGSAHLHLLKFHRMTINITMFCLTCGVMISFLALPIVLKNRIDVLQNLYDTASTCQSVIATYQLSYSMAIWTTIAMILWLSRIILDPILNILLDSRFLEVVKTTLLFQTAKSATNSIRKFRAISTPDMNARRKFLLKCSNENIIPISVIIPSGTHYFRYSDDNGVNEEKIKKKEEKKKRFAHVRMDERVL